VKLHQLFSFQLHAAKAIAPGFAKRAKIDDKGKVQLTRALAETMIELFLRSMSILRASGKLGAFLLQLSPAIFTLQAFS